MAFTARLDLTADVLQSCKLPSAGDESEAQIDFKDEDSHGQKGKPLTYQLRQSASEGKRGMTCASLGGRGDSGSLRQKADI